MGSPEVRTTEALNCTIIVFQLDLANLHENRVILYLILTNCVVILLNDIDIRILFLLKQGFAAA